MSCRITYIVVPTPFSLLLIFVSLRCDSSNLPTKPIDRSTYRIVSVDVIHYIDRQKSHIQKAPYQAFRFETPGMSPETIAWMAFEFVLVRDDSLAGFAATPDPNTFAQYLSSCKKCDDNHYQHSNNNNNNGSSSNDCEPTAGCIFANLGGDATLVSPIDWSSSSSSTSMSSCYGHLANFVRGAPDDQITKLWRLVAETLKEKLLVEVVATTRTATAAAGQKQQQQQPLWFSTAGDGVAWLHFRFDSRPKYYHYKPYKVFIPSNP